MFIVETCASFCQVDGVTWLSTYLIDCSGRSINEYVALNPLYLSLGCVRCVPELLVFLYTFLVENGFGIYTPLHQALKK